MAATILNLIKKGCMICYDGSPSSTFKNKLDIIGSRFSTLKGFKYASISTLNNLRTIEGTLCFRPLTTKEENAIITYQNEIDLNKDIIQNFILILTKSFIKRQLLMLSNMCIESFNANPILCSALNLKTPEEFIRYNAYQAIGRSIVTSMGYLVQDLLLYSNEFIFEGKEYSQGVKTKFDLVIDRLGEVKSFLEIKSGFNDMDAGQVKHYVEEIETVEAEGNRGYIGITYGKKTDNTITSGLLKTYWEDWEKKTLVGRELWDFVSENENYHTILIKNVEEVAKAMLKNISIINKIEQKIEQITSAFYKQYNGLEEYYESLW